MKPSPEYERKLLGLLTEFLLALRREYLATGANAITHWEQLQNRMTTAARTSVNVADWITRTRTTLRLPAPSRDSSHCSVALEREIAEESLRDADVLRLIERRAPLLVARARVLAEERKEAALAAKEVSGEA